MESTCQDNFTYVPIKSGATEEQRTGLSRTASTPSEDISDRASTCYSPHVLALSLS